jgi:hypothetical protein
MKRVTQQPWFGPKRYAGWGWRIASWQGLAVTAAMAAALIILILAWPHVAAAWIIGILVIYLGVVVLTGDPPGGPRS